MPRRDGTGPYNQTGSGRLGRNGGYKLGPTGYCVCTGCGERVAHTRGVPCTSMKCPKCGAALTRDY